MPPTQTSVTAWVSKNGTEHYIRTGSTRTLCRRAQYDGEHHGTPRQGCKPCVTLKVAEDMAKTGGSRKR